MGKVCKYVIHNKWCIDVRMLNSSSNQRNPNLNNLILNVLMFYNTVSDKCGEINLCIHCF